MALAGRLSRACALWLAAAGAAPAQDLPALFRVTGVAADDVLNVRAEPTAGAEKVGALAPSAAGVEVVELGSGGRWGRVNLAEFTGWVAMRYMAHEGGPDWHRLEAPLSCYGTEPFWRLTIAPEADEMMLERMGEEALGFGRRVTSPGFDRPRTVGFSAQGAEREGFGVIRAETCSDGMSDRVMGLSFRMFLAGPEGMESYLGCCTLEQ